MQAFDRTGARQRPEVLPVHGEALGAGVWVFAAHGRHRPVRQQPEEKGQPQRVGIGVDQPAFGQVARVIQHVQRAQRRQVADQHLDRPDLVRGGCPDVQQQPILALAPGVHLERSRRVALLAGPAQAGARQPPAIIDGLQRRMRRVQPVEILQGDHLEGELPGSQCKDRIAKIKTVEVHGLRAFAVPPQPA